MEQDYAAPAMGTVEIASGRWQWTVYRQSHMSYLLFRHQEKPRDEMQAVVTDARLTPERVSAAAADPLHRIWEDRDGLLWRISLEFPTLPSSGRQLFQEGMTMVISRGGVRLAFRVSNDTAIGALTCEELAILLYGRS